jgi:hypothetical protein
MSITAPFPRSSQPFDACESAKYSRNSTSKRLACALAEQVQACIPVENSVAIVANAAVLVLVSDPDFHGHPAAARQLCRRFGQLPLYIHVVIVDCRCV